MSHVRGTAATAPTITTVAGGVGGPGKATTVSLSDGPDGVVAPCGLAAAKGALYVGDVSSVRKISPEDHLTTPAGDGGLGGPYGDRGPAKDAWFSHACAVAFDSAGNLVIADAGAEEVRVVAARTGTFYGQAMAAGDVYAVAGTGDIGDSGDGGLATLSDLSIPNGVAVDRAGNLVIADSGSNRVRVVALRTGTSYGQAMTGGHIYTIAGNGNPFSGLGDGGPATAARLDYPDSVAFDSHGNILIADMLDNLVRVVAASTGEFYGQAMTAGDIYTIAGNGKRGYSGDGGPAVAAEFFSPSTLAADAVGNVLITDDGNNRVRVVATRTGRFYSQAMTAGDVYTVAGDGSGGFSGDGGPATAAELAGPSGVALDSAGNLLIADIVNGRVRIVPAKSGSLYGQPMTEGDIYSIAGVGDTGASGDGRPAAKAELNYPSSTAVDALGNTIVADSRDNAVRAVAAVPGTYYGQAMIAGDIYTIAGNGQAGFSGDGGPAVDAEFNVPLGASVGPEGDLVIADMENQRIRVVAAKTGTLYGQKVTAGDIYTIAGDGTTGFSGDGGPAGAAELNDPSWAVTGKSGDVFIADSGNNRIRVVAARSGTIFGQKVTAGDVYTIAGDGSIGFSGDGGPATKANLYSPSGLAVDPAGNLVIADSFNQRVRVVAVRTGTYYGQHMSAGDIYTIAGGGRGLAGCAGPATTASLSATAAVGYDSSGNLLIADEQQVCVVATSTGTFYGQSMTKGDIYALAGDGDQGFSGDGGPAAAATLSLPGGLAVKSNGNVLIADTQNGRIRMVSP